MGRELRRVAPNWKHPKTEKYNSFSGRYEECYQPCYDRGYETALKAWFEGRERWKLGQHPLQLNGTCDAAAIYEDWEGDAPRHDYHRPDWLPEEMTWFQVYETVSEGTPVTPPFATREELVEYLVTHGDFWDQERRAEGRVSPIPCDPWTRKEAEAFVFGAGWAPSLVVNNGTVMSGVAAIAETTQT